MRYLTYIRDRRKLKHEIDRLATKHNRYSDDPDHEEFIGQHGAKTLELMDRLAWLGWKRYGFYGEQIDSA